MKEYLHLFEDAKTFKPVLEQKYLVIAEYAGLQFDCFAKWQAFGSYEHWFILSGVHYQGDQPTVTHVLDLSKLTTKAEVRQKMETLAIIYETDYELWRKTGDENALFTTPDDKKKAGHYLMVLAKIKNDLRRFISEL